MSVFSIATQNFIAWAQRCNTSYPHCLLTYIQVHKAANFTACILFGTLLLEASHECHFLMHLQEFSASYSRQRCCTADCHRPPLSFAKQYCLSCPAYTIVCHDA